MTEGSGLGFGVGGQKIELKRGRIIAYLEVVAAPQVGTALAFEPIEL